MPIVPSLTSAVLQAITPVIRGFIEEYQDLLNAEDAPGAAGDADVISVNTGNSTASVTERSNRTRFDHQHCRDFIMDKVLGDNPTAEFESVYRISKERFMAIHDDIQETGNKFFFNEHWSPVDCPDAATHTVSCVWCTCECFCKFLSNVSAVC